MTTPHKKWCFVYVHARALLGVDRRGLCNCGAEQINTKVQVKAPA